ncbi:bpX6 domain-containing protein, partial [Kitasatospora sp. NPDC056181]|uniref:bpX6 domain-containing protein n=1 Tax=Kitasatospora sp. NPDC056181 TaxID=3345737 RepID=UPI0035D9BCFE
MSATPAAAFGATVTAAGYLLDVPVIGAAEAAARVLAHWQEGAELRELPDGRWLLVLVTAVDGRAAQAPGQPLTRTPGGALVAAGTGDSEARTGQLSFTAAGLKVTHTVTELAELDPSAWLDPVGLTPHRPRPVGAVEPAVEPVLEALPSRPQPDLRRAAGIGPRSERAHRLTKDAPAGPRRSFSPPRLDGLAALAGPAAYWTALVVMLGAGLLAAASFAGLIAERGFRPGGFLVALAVGLVLA